MLKQLFSLSGRCALVTGSATGLGFGYAEGLGLCGAQLIMNDVNKERLKEAADKLRAKGITVHEAAFDVSSAKAVESAFADIDEKGLVADILVNNAGIQFRKPMLDLDVSDWQRVLDINLTGAFLVAKAAAARMIKAGKKGKIINIGSLTSEMARATVAPYTATKGAIKMLTRSMTAEWAQHGISANAVAPGYIVTELNTALVENPEFDGWVRKRTPAARWGMPEDLTGTVVFLASPASDFINGQLIFVDGGIVSVL
ncbi:SDR family oxidoreductase [uncultured Cohaesibacter sp.]|uniref:SDR family oxidoreductase n=1 Tax=uncultured Cohaesibacter sp. TaxID=1002546 RepID=UPI002930680B|nr:SDR family oxidoreductase [uncultured Cohaesibacter sp.]